MYGILKIANLTDDNRPYVNISVLGSNFRCLLDSGANISVAGKGGSRFLRSLGLKCDTRFMSSINTADCTSHLIEGVFYVPIEYRDETHLISVFSVPSLPLDIVMGINFFKKFNVLLYLNENGWSCASLSSVNSINRIISFDDLGQREKCQLQSIVAQFKEIGGEKLGRTSLYTHVINTGNALPIKQRGYAVSPAVEKRFGAELKRMIDLGVVEHSISPWCSPAVLVKKADGRDRLCVDSRKLNAVTVRDSYPLPRVSEILDRLGRSRFLSKIDLKDFFWQIPLSEDSKQKTAFSVPGHGLYQFTRLPFGLHNSAQAAQRLMNSVFGHTDNHIFAYLDDIIIVSETFDDHLRDLEFVLERLKYAGLTINCQKSSFCVPTLKYLGYVLDQGGLRTDPDKVDVIVNYPRPVNFTELKRFIGIASWYRRFVRNFASIAAPLHDLTKDKKGKAKLEWDTKADKAFIDLKNDLVSTPLLTIPDFNETFSIHCDASDIGLGAVICQGLNDQPIAFASRKLKGAETRYSVTERECLAVVFAIQKFRPYIEGYHFKIYTDHSSLIWLFRQENPPGRLARWIMGLSQYDFEIHHRKGDQNIVPDALSRLPFSQSIDLISFDVKPEDSWYIRMLAKVSLSPKRFCDWRLVNDRLYFRFKSDQHRPPGDPWRLVIPESARKLALGEAHDCPTSGHQGAKRTKYKLLQRYYWPGAGKDAEDYVKRCQKCKEVKQPTTKRAGFMGKFKHASIPFQMISMDLLGPLPRSTQQNAFILVICDWVTKWSMLFPIRHATASKVVELVENRWFNIYGIPETIIMDNGKQFSGKEFGRLAEKYGIQRLWFNARYHPQNNPTERVNKVIGNMLRAYVKDNHRHWDKHIGDIGVSLRTAVSEVTGFTPYYLTFGREFSYSASDFSAYIEQEDPSLIRPARAEFLKNFSQIYEEVFKRMKMAHDRNKKYYDQNKRLMVFNVGDTVYKHNFVLSDAANYFSAKLAPKYIKCKIKGKISDLVYELEDESGANLGKWHVKDLRPA